jgi:ubiquinone/menaquinone biosynthesis C-methylase UbiE
MHSTTATAPLHTKGAVVHSAAWYDLLVWLLTLGRERRFRERLVRPARLQRGETVLDVGCGTGGLALAAKREVGTGTVFGVDASPEMIERAKRKARRAQVDVNFQTGLAESLPFTDSMFDVVLSTVMLHHLPGETRRRGVQEMRRVLKPGGRLLGVDFGRPIGGRKKGLLGHIHRRGGVDARDLIALVTDAGLEVVENGPAGKWDLQFILARKPVHS